MNGPIVINDSNDVQWQSSGYRYTNPVEITNNLWQCQLIVAAEQLAHAREWVTRLEIAFTLGANCQEQVKIWRKLAELIKNDIHYMVTT